MNMFLKYYLSILSNLTNFNIPTLQYNTKYYYKIEASGSSREFWFQTPPKIHPDAPYTFGIIGKNCDESRGVYLFQLAKTD